MLSFVFQVMFVIYCTIDIVKKWFQVVKIKKNDKYNSMQLLFFSDSRSLTFTFDLYDCLYSAMVCRYTMVSADYLKNYWSQSSYLTCRLVTTSRQPLLILGSPGQRSHWNVKMVSWADYVINLSEGKSSWLPLTFHQ